MFYGGLHVIVVFSVFDTCKSITDLYNFIAHYALNFHYNTILQDLCCTKRQLFWLFCWCNVNMTLTKVSLFLMQKCIFLLKYQWVQLWPLLLNLCINVLVWNKIFLMRLLNLHINIQVWPKIYPNEPLKTCTLMGLGLWMRVEFLKIFLH